MNDESKIAPAADAAAESFLELTPQDDSKLVEKSGRRSTGLCVALPSYENRVFEMELEDKAGEKERVVAKFYRPGRWLREQIQDEHDFLLELEEEEFPAAAPLKMPDGQTLFEVNGMFAATFRKAKGRAPEDLTSDDYRSLGGVMARMHNIGARHVAKHRRRLTTQEFGDKSLDVLLEGKWIKPVLEQSYVDVCENILDWLEPRLAKLPILRLHGDAHRGNVLSTGSREALIDPNSNRADFVLVDFDDMVMGPAVQDLWLFSPGRDEDSIADRDALLEGYTAVRRFDPAQLQIVEALRALRVIHYSAWIARRYDDPAFVRTFDQFKEARYWEEELNQLREISARLL